MEMRNSGAIVLILKLQYGLFPKEEIQPGPIVMLLTICRAAPTICASACCTLVVNIVRLDGDMDVSGIFRTYK